MGWRNEENRLDAQMPPIKTAAGQSELSTRARRISQRHRTVLFLVDGRRSASDVRAMAMQAGVPEHCYDELLALGLIELPAVAAAPAPAPAPAVNTRPARLPDVDLPLPVPDSVNGGLDSLLPASRTLSPESIAADSRFDDKYVDSNWLRSQAGLALPAEAAAIVQARAILLSAVRNAAPVAGSITMLRLRRANTADELKALLDEVESRIARPHRSLAAAQTIRHVRDLLDGRVDLLLPS